MQVRILKTNKKQFLIPVFPILFTPNTLYTVICDEVYFHNCTFFIMCIFLFGVFELFESCWRTRFINKNDQIGQWGNKNAISSLH